MPAVMNGANERAVAAFLEDRIGFLDIADIIEKTMDSYNVKYDYSINDLVEADRWAAETADALIKAKEN